jgi:hypothetical protein
MASVKHPGDTRCGARTRSGKPCIAPGTGRGGRCKNHGGLSTGPKTIEGRQRVIEARHPRKPYRTYSHARVMGSDL